MKEETIGIKYWRKEAESLKSQLQEKNEDLDSLKRSYDFTYESLTHLRDKLEKCPVSGEVVVKLKGIYHTFFKAKINHPDYMDERLDETDCQGEELGKDVVKRDTLTNGGEIHYEDKVTGEKVLVKGITKYDVLEMKYKAEREENTRLLQQVAQQKSENEVLHRKVKDLCHKLCQARRERDKFAHEIEDLRVASEAALRAAELVKAHPEICSTFTVHLSDESKKIAELNKKVAGLQKKNSELSEQLKSKQSFHSRFFREAL